MPEQDYFPRVLVLCDEPINKVGGGGVTMGNLFRGWPKHALAQVWAHHRFEIDADICPNYLRLGSHAFPGDKWAPRGLKRQKKLARYAQGLIRPGIRMNYRQILQWARAYEPDVIYSQATLYPMYTWWLPRWLARDLDVPLVNHIMDDWSTAAAEEWLPIISVFMRRILQRQLRLLFQAAACNLAICQQMAEAFAIRYDQPFIPFHNAIDLDEWLTPKTHYAPWNRTFEVVYLGALIDNMQLRSLRDIALEISNLTQDGMDMRLTIYAGNMYSDAFQQYLGGIANVVYGGTVARSDLCATLAAADLLVIPVNFDSHSVKLARYSMPTKVPEYMASGTPILVYAPPEVPPTTYARSEGWGWVVDQQQPSKLKQALQKLAESAELRAQLGQRARALAERNHNAQVVRTRFRAILSNAVTK